MDEPLVEISHSSEVISLESFVSKQLELLELERASEIEENKALQECYSVKSLQKRGVCIPKLRVRSTTTGLFGRSLKTFETFWSSSTLPSHCLCSGDIVGVGTVNSDGKIEVITTGVITRVTDLVLTVAFEKDSNSLDLESDVQYIIVKLTNDVTYKRLKRALKTLESKGNRRHLVNVLFGEKTPSAVEDLSLETISFYNTQLNDSQKAAVGFVLSQKEVAILHGPPGTGKTTTVVECILQAVQQKLKIIACAPSNVAVDNLVEKLATNKIKMVRLGHPARSLSSIQKYSLDAIVSRYDGSDVIDEMHKEIDKLRGKIEKVKGSGYRKSLWAENRSLLKEVKEREKSIVKQILTNVDVVLATLTSASDLGPLKYVEEDHFDICFIDECSQALEASCWIPLMFVKKCVLSGDHNQLPPTIISEKAAKGGFSVTLMERLLKLHGDSIKKMLTIQYRMHYIIMQWPSEQLYENKLQADKSVYSHLLSSLPGVESNEDTMIPLLLIDTSGCGLHELQAEDEESKGNEGEADLVMLHVENLIKSGVNSTDIAVITPYNLQVDFIKSRISGKYPKLEIKSVDGFQGREKEAVILSLVRSNDNGDVGFLSEDRRINVAITRAKRQLTVICNSETVSHHDFLKSFVNYCAEKGEVRTAFQYEKEIGQYCGIVSKRLPSNKGEITSKTKKKPAQKQVSSISASKLGRGTFVEKDTSYLREQDNRFAIKEKYEKVLQKFTESNKVSLSFSPSLSAFERRTVHEVAEELGLYHMSTGEGNNRCIEVRKDLSNANSALPISEQSSSKNVDFQAVTTKNIFENICSSEENSVQCNKNELHETKATAEVCKQDSKMKKEQKSKVLNNPKLKVLQLKQVPGDASEDDFDALIAQVVKADKTCCFQKCKKSVATLVQICQFCKGRFCFNHFMPEIHGCGDAVKAYARSQIRKDGVIYAGSGKPIKKVDPVKQSYLQKKLDEKLTELSKQRRSKTK